MPAVHEGRVLRTEGRGDAVIELEIVVPLPPMPKMRPRFGQGRAHNDERYSQWKRDFGVHCWGKPSLGAGPFGIHIQFETTTGRMRPDLDNAAGAVLDALQDAGVIGNDRDAVDLRAVITKRAVPQILITLWNIEE